MMEAEIFVNEEWEIEFLFVDKALMRSAGIFGNAEDHVIALIELGHVVSKVARLCGATGRGVFGVKVQDHRFPLCHVITQRVRRAVLVNGRELG